MTANTVRTTTVAVADLIRDARLRYRSPYFSAAGDAERYAETMLEAVEPGQPSGWGNFPPVTCVELTEKHRFRVEEPGDFGTSKSGFVTYPAGGLVLVGGFTRTQAAGLALIEEIPALVHSGDWPLAMRLAWRENADHGKPRSSDEIKSVLQSIHQIAEYAALGERAVADMAGCSRATVNRFRRELEHARQRATDELSPTKSASGPTRSGDGQFVASVKDKWHRPVPTHLRNHFEVNYDLDRYAKRIRDVVLELGRLKHGVEGKDTCLSPGLSVLDLPQLSRALLKSADDVDCYRPFLVCPFCDGSECDQCGHRGWLTRPESERLPPAMERKAASYRDGAAH